MGKKYVRCKYCDSSFLLNDDLDYRERPSHANIKHDVVYYWCPACNTPQESYVFTEDSARHVSQTERSVAANPVLNAVPASDSEPPDVLGMVVKYLKDNNYDGLCSDECGCGINDLAPCGSIGNECLPAYLFRNYRGYDEYYSNDKECIEEDLASQDADDGI